MRKGAKASPTSLTPFILLSSWFIGLVFSFPSTSLLTRRDWISSLSLVAMSSPKPVRWGIVGVSGRCCLAFRLSRVSLKERYLMRPCALTVLLSLLFPVIARRCLPEKVGPSILEMQWKRACRCDASYSRKSG